MIRPPEEEDGEAAGVLRGLEAGALPPQLGEGLLRGESKPEDVLRGRSKPLLPCMLLGRSYVLLPFRSYVRVGGVYERGAALGCGEAVRGAGVARIPGLVGAARSPPKSRLLSVWRGVVG